QELPRPARRTWPSRSCPEENIRSKEEYARTHPTKRRTEPCKEITITENRNKRDQRGTSADSGLRTRMSPRTSTSILERKKQSMASSGRQTMGSLSLNEVFRTTGTPVRLANSRISPQ